MIKGCVICGNKFNAIKSMVTCNLECSKIRKLNNMKKWRKENPNRRRTDNCPICNALILVGSSCCRSCSSKKQIEKYGHPLKGIGHSIETKKKMSEYRKGKYKKENNPNWKGGIKGDGHGYIQIHKPEHPHALNNKYVYEHRLVMEKHIGRYLNSEEIVHHINRIKTDNRLENLRLMSNSEHLKYHRDLKKLEDEFK